VSRKSVVARKTARLFSSTQATNTLDRLRVVPGVAYAGAVNGLPPAGMLLSGDIIAEDLQIPRGLVPAKPAVSAEYFQAMAIPLLMRNTLIVLLASTFMLHVASAAQASSGCSSVLTADQLTELDVMVFPTHAYSAHLNEGLR
jgi:hypothetical protein